MERNVPARTVLVAGGSLAGLMTGAILAREGWNVRIFERVAGGIEGRGAGIATHDALFTAFERAGARVDDEMGIGLTGRTAFNRQGEAIGHYPYYQLLSSWSNLYRRLRSAVPPACYELGHEVVKVDESAERVEITFGNGGRAQGDLLVGADGIWSSVRAALNPAAVPGYCGYVAWRGLIDENELPQKFRDFFSPLHTFYIERGEQFILYAVAGADDSVQPGRRRFGFLWYRSVDETTELPALLTDIDGNRNSHSISPAKIDPRHVARLREDAGRILPAEFAHLVRLTPHPFIQPIFDLASEKIAFGRTAIVGDAAFVARPHVGAGVLKAACDAMSLADALRDCGTLDEALRRYEQERIPAGLDLVQRARYFGGYLEEDRPGRPAAPVLPFEEVIRDSGRG